ncbi:MAG: RluA family pseudouridine synthase [Eubacterium sp.]|nr:RluA family pseudouridine synthase [Eubacterium sp.]
MSNLFVYTVENEFEGIRLDKYLSLAYPDKSRNFFQKLLKNNDVSVNDKAEKASYKVISGDEIRVNVPKDEEIEIIPQDIPLDILYEDEDVLVVNKPKGMVVHPAPGHPDKTLVNAVMYHCKDDLSAINGKIRPGIVHRIDMDTTGALIVCKNDFSHNIIAKQIKDHSVNRIYYGFVAGNIKDDEGTIETTIGRHPVDRKKMAVNIKGGRDAITHFKVLERFSSGVSTFAQFKLETGRTHQIRVHMASINHPLLGDPVYGSGKNPYHLQGQALHAGVIGFIHPRSGEYVEVRAPYPDYFETLFKRFR